MMLFPIHMSLSNTYVSFQYISMCLSMHMCIFLNPYVCLSLYIHASFYIHLYVSLSIHIYMFLFIRTSLSLYVYRFVNPYLGRTCMCVTHTRQVEDDALSNLYVCHFLSIYVYFSLSICTSLSLYIRLFLLPSVRLSLYIERFLFLRPGSCSIYTTSSSMSFSIYRTSSLSTYVFLYI